MYVPVYTALHAHKYTLMVLFVGICKQWLPTNYANDNENGHSHTL